MAETELLQTIKKAISAKFQIYFTPDKYECTCGFRITSSKYGSGIHLCIYIDDSLVSIEFYINTFIECNYEAACYHAKKIGIYNEYALANRLNPYRRDFYVNYNTRFNIFTAIYNHLDFDDDVIAHDDFLTSIGYELYHLCKQLYNDLYYRVTDTSYKGLLLVSIAD